MNSFLMWVGSLLILALAALFAGPHFVDWNGFRGVFEEEASRILGRDVRVGGDVNLRLLPAPYVRFEELQIADTTGIAGAPLFHAESFTMWLSVPPLLKGVLEAQRIELERPSLTLAVDDQGFGNWRSLSAGYGSLPFVPAGVELQSVRITEGTVAVNLQRTGEIARLEHINGELAAKKLAGPYNFRGSLEMHGVQRDVRFATTEPDADGSIGLNGLILVPASDDRYTLDLRLSDLWERPRIEGDLAGRIRIAGAGGRGDSISADLKAKLLAGPQSAELKEVAASIENGGQPQLVAGKISAEWGAQRKINASLSSRWLDLDRLAGGQGAPPSAAVGAAANTAGNRGAGAQGQSEQPAAGAGQQSASNPLQTAPTLLAAFISHLPEQIDVQAELKVDQVNLGGEAVSDVAVMLQRSRGSSDTATVRAVLPGGARFDFTGHVEGGSSPVFSGDLYVGGASAARVIGWAMGPGSASEISSDGPFAVDGTARLEKARLKLSDARAEFSGVPVRGSIDWQMEGEGKRLDVSIEGREIDTRWIGVNMFEMPAVVDLLSVTEAANSDTSAEKGVLPGWLAGEYGNVRLKVRADTLRNGEAELRDVDSEIALRDGRIEVIQANFETEAGLAVSLEGEIDEPSKAPRGSLRFVVAADDQAAAISLAESLGGEAARGHFRERISELAPFRLAGQLSLSERLAGAADIYIDGKANGGSAKARLQLDGGIDRWRDSPADIQVRVKDGKAARWVANWLGGAEGFETSNSSLNGGSGLLKVAGIPREGMLTMATLEGDGFSLIYDGKSGVAGDMLSALDGEFVVNARRGNDVLALVGIELADGADLGPAQGTVEFKRQNGSYVFKPRDMIFSGSRVAGTIEVSREKGDGNRLHADLTTDTASLPRLMSAILAPPADGSTAPEDTDPEQQPSGEQAQQPGDALLAGTAIFSDQPFDMSPLVDLSGRIDLKASRLMLHEDMHLDDASLTIGLGGSRVDLEVSQATALRGEVSGKLSLSRAPAGVTAKGEISVKGADLAMLTKRDQQSPGKPLASGRVDLSADFSGQALGPRGMVSALSGKGKLAFKNAVVYGLDPAIVTAVALSAVASDEPIDDFPDRLREKLGDGKLAIGSRTADLRIVDGAVRVAPVPVKAEQGVTEVVTTFDIASLAVDSEWRIRANSAVAGEADWPPVSVTFVGPVAQIPALEARLQADAVERELTVRRMERNVQELERLRRLDEEAAARERERQRKLEEESAARERERLRLLQEERARGMSGSATTGGTPVPGETAPGIEGTITSEPLPPIEGIPTDRKDATLTEQSFKAGQQPQAEAITITDEGADAQAQRPPAPRPVSRKPPSPQLSPSDIMRQQLLGTN